MSMRTDQRDRRAPEQRSGARRLHPNELPGLRVPGAFDHFETAVMMLLNQYMRPEEASELMDRIVEKHGDAN